MGCLGCFKTPWKKKKNDLEIYQYLSSSSNSHFTDLKKIPNKWVTEIATQSLFLFFPIKHKTVNGDFLRGFLIG